METSKFGHGCLRVQPDIVPCIESLRDDLNTKEQYAGIEQRFFFEYPLQDYAALAGMVMPAGMRLALDGSFIFGGGVPFPGSTAERLITADMLAAIIGPDGIVTEQAGFEGHYWWRDALDQQFMEAVAARGISTSDAPATGFAIRDRESSHCYLRGLSDVTVGLHGPNWANLTFATLKRDLVNGIKVSIDPRYGSPNVQLGDVDEVVAYLAGKAGIAAQRAQQRTVPVSKEKVEALKAKLDAAQQRHSPP